MWVKALTIAGLLAGTHVGTAFAADTGIQSLDAVRSAAVNALRRELGDTINKDVELTAAPLDPRLRLTACSGAPVGSAAIPRNSQARAIVRVSCSSPLWNLNVPVDLRRHAPVLVLKRAIGRGERITADAVDVQTRVLPGLASPFVADLAGLDSRLTRRPLAAGTAVTAESLTAAFVVQRGQPVVLTARLNGLEVRAPGTALADAAVNQRVRVQNTFSLKIVDGVAETQGVVRVNP